MYDRAPGLIAAKREVKAQLNLIDKIFRELTLTEQGYDKVEKWKLQLNVNLDCINDALSEIMDELEESVD